MRIFSIVAIAAGILAGAAIGTTLPLHAGTMPFKTPNQLRGTCSAAGGNYSAPDTAGVYVSSRGRRRDRLRRQRQLCREPATPLRRERS